MFKDLVYDPSLDKEELTTIYKLRDKNNSFICSVGVTIDNKLLLVANEEEYVFDTKTQYGDKINGVICLYKEYKDKGYYLEGYEK